MYLSWKVGRRKLELDAPRIMGILNVTPDSFSDGGRFVDPATAAEHGLRMARDGADILDVGGESTRPGAGEVPVEEEIRRVVPVIESLAGRLDVPISIDTRKAAVARAAIEAGATIVNDVSGLGHDPEMIAVLSETGVGAVLMHMRGTPATMHRHTDYADVVAEVAASLSQTLERCRAHGIDEERLVLDPGIGFAKDTADNLRLLAFPEQLHALGRPLLVGVSRKSLLGKLYGLEVDQRDDATLALTAISAFLGVSIFRVHRVRAACQAVRVASSIRSVRADDGGRRRRAGARAPEVRS